MIIFGVMFANCVVHSLRLRLVAEQSGRKKKLSREIWNTINENEERKINVGNKFGNVENVGK